MSQRELAVDEWASRRSSSAVMAMVIFVASESMFFMAFFGVYWSTYASQPVWPPPDVPLLSLGFPTAAVAALLVSGATIALAFRAAVRRNSRGAARWIGATIVLALAYIVLSILGNRDLGFGIHEGIFGSLFYVTTGLALAHVVGGIVLLAMVGSAAVSGELAIRRDPAQIAAIYWSFVVALGVIVYVVFFLLVSSAVTG
jgi:heme/copper-type cytochrome/quinol oxidase subunit 3